MGFVISFALQTVIFFADGEKLYFGFQPKLYYIYLNFSQREKYHFATAKYHAVGISLADRQI